jgi:hypothetical protein
MKVVTGTVRAGKVEIPAEAIGEGVHVMVLALEAAEPIRLTPAEEEELLQAMDDIRRGEYVDGQELLDEIRSLRQS